MSQRHEAAKAAIRATDGPLAFRRSCWPNSTTSWPPESRRWLRRALLAEVGRGAYQLEPMDATDIAEAVSVIDRYRDLALGLADASLVVLSRRHD